MKKVLNVSLAFLIGLSFSTAPFLPLTNIEDPEKIILEKRVEVENLIQLQQSLSKWRKDLEKDLEDLEKEYPDALPYPNLWEGKPEFLPIAPYQQKYFKAYYNLP